MINRITNKAELIPLLNFSDERLNSELFKSVIMNEIIVEIYNGWIGKVGLERVIEKVNFLFEKVPQYAKVVDKSEIETLELFAKSRNCNYTNYFQEANFPDLSAVFVFDTINDFREKFASDQYQCPSCHGISTDYQICNSGQIIDKKTQKVCDWKVYGIFGDLGKGIKVIIKEKFSDIPKPISMFKPMELI